MCPPDDRASLQIAASDPALMPSRAHADDAGLDLRAADAVRLEPGDRALVDTGLRIALPTGTVGLVCPRSGMAAKHGITVLNGPGIIDAGYRGPLKVALVNTDPREAFEIQRGDRIAQLLVTPIIIPEIQRVDALGESAGRGVGGFGSSGGFGAQGSEDTK
ncbi:MULTISPECIES: dUTP diphosphatase [Helcobacillus]|uniref:dUTP diphosphatase n=1 Tax=Helcobacillus massiliensis TaxID=521392 RepID=A0A839R1C5_9MICO|nr:MULTISPECIES: dUTP diphosphatase [Helcobacillus]MBB3022296.1 dUTP pyrophosphatase [Helcobacillus massiliensis]MCG7426483.1 dUTP diphosphatase [Helcobacillus sp. ACRRO]